MQEMKRRASASSTRSVAPTLRGGLATAKHLDAELLATLPRAAKPRLGNFNEQQLDEVLSATLARAAKPRLGEFTAQGLANTAQIWPGLQGILRK